MRNALLALLALGTLGIVIFLFVEVHAARSPALDEPTSVAAPQPSPQPPQPSPTPPPSAPAAAVPAKPAAGPADPLDTVVNGKTRRQWHAYYADRERQMQAEIDRRQEIVSRAERGEEPDPGELGEAHVRIRELRDLIKVDQLALQQIDATP
jgi:hypothetical protein